MIDMKRHRKHTITILLFLVSLVLCIVGAYILIIAVTPAIVSRKLSIATIEVKPKVDQIIIPQIGVQEGIYTGGVEALEKGVWHRYPERGKPGSGNFILSAHRFVMGRWPGETLRKSPFYNIGKLKIGDTLFVDWHGRRFTYKVAKIYKVKPNDTNVEAPSTKHKLTLYSCTLSGSTDGRLVIEATLLP